MILVGKKTHYILNISVNNCFCVHIFKFKFNTIMYNCSRYKTRRQWQIYLVKWGLIILNVPSNMSEDIFSFKCIFCRSLFVLLFFSLLAIVLSVPLRYMDSDFPFGIFKLFFHTVKFVFETVWSEFEGNIWLWQCTFSIYLYGNPYPGYAYCITLFNNEINTNVHTVLAPFSTSTSFACKKEENNKVCKLIIKPITA